MEESAFYKLMRRERMVTIIGIAMIAIMAWGYLAWMAFGMRADAASMVMPGAASWSAPYALMIFIMWAVMMVAMMTPSAAPMILTFARVNADRSKGASVLGPTGLFTLAYILVWTGFSAAATFAQWGLVAMAQLSPMMATTDMRIGGVILIVAGLFQWTPLKHRCLEKCRTPIGFLMTEWRDGPAGAFVMGLRHGIFCLGCCWALMLVLFVVGVMNLVWIALLSVFVLLEKVTDAGRLIARIGGLALISSGIWLVVM
ncbi:MAG: DUF2182 domain-containing protein [Nitrospinota bacterium]|nr:DUF2182 domain-containing protein [Nitrospinota bacterium]